MTKKKLVVEKHEESADFSLEDKQLTKKNDNYYVSASKLSKSLSYDYSWDIQKNTASAADISGATSIYPSKYDLREKGRATTVKNQGSLGTCWASASVSALETALLPEESVQFSVDHMTLKNSFSQTQNDGGEYTMGMAYLTAWQGPVYEADESRCIIGNVGRSTGMKKYWKIGIAGAAVVAGLLVGER